MKIEAGMLCETVRPGMGFRTVGWPGFSGKVVETLRIGTLLEKIEDQHRIASRYHVPCDYDPVALANTVWWWCASEEFKSGRDCLIPEPLLKPLPPPPAIDDWLDVQRKLELSDT